MPATIPYLHRELLHPLIISEAVYRNMEDHFYWSDCWEPDFYVELARKGFISISTQVPPNDCFLLPEMQRAYAVLDWHALRAGRTMKRLLGKVRSPGTDHVMSGLYLVISSTTGPVMEGISAAYSQNSWLYPPYVELMKALEGADRSGFRLWGVELRDAAGTLAGGELGYTIGTVYTSLSGFLDRSLPQANHWGKLQLYGLAGLLRQQGYAFWNLGHPYMQYKLDLGAVILPRQEFLVRWQAAVDAAPDGPGLGALENQWIPCSTALAATGLATP